MVCQRYRVQLLTMKKGIANSSHYNFRIGKISLAHDPTAQRVHLFSSFTVILRHLQHFQKKLSAPLLTFA
jgi:hypothetical protein